jgi:5-methylcytosine-specific restriction endonuclease McrA
MFLACGECGKYYQPKKSYQFGRCRKCQKYCDFLNRKECEKAESVEANRQQIKKVYWKKGNICLWCASVFSIKTRSSRNDGKYCSRQCRFDYLAWRTEVRRVQAEGDSWGDNITVPCLVCAKPFNTSGNRSRICSVGCKNKQAADRARAKYIPKEPGCCGDCGMPLERATMEYCPKCSRARLRQAKRISNRNREKIIKINTVEIVNPLVVYNRDGWVCQLCLGKIKKNSKQNDPLEATLDHIIPISKGGEHSYKNVQCAHRQCNAVKSDKTEGQLRLFG